MNELVSEIVALTQIRRYLSETMGNPNWNKKVVYEMSNMLILIDKKIVSLMQNKEFKTYIDYNKVEDIVKEVVDINNIKSGIINRNT